MPLVTPVPSVQATNHLLLVDEVLGGANGNDNIEFIEIRMCCSE